MAKLPVPGDRIRVVTTIFPHAAPKGSERVVVREAQANSPPVPYYISRVNDVQLGFYLNEIEVLDG